MCASIHIERNFIEVLSEVGHWDSGGIVLPILMQTLDENGLV
jgi:hypothetical protein